MVGYRLFNEEFFAMSIVMGKTGKQTRKICPINDYSCLCNKSSEFLYKPVEIVEALAIRRENFNNIMHDDMAKNIRPFIARNYKTLI